MVKWLQWILGIKKVAAAAIIPGSPEIKSPVASFYDYEGEEDVQENKPLQNACQGTHDPLRIEKHSDTLLPPGATCSDSIKVTGKHFREKVSTPVSQCVQNGSKRVECCSLIPSPTSYPEHRQPAVPGTQLTTASTGQQLLPPPPQPSPSSNTHCISGTPHAHCKSPLRRDTWQTASDASRTSPPATHQLTSLDAQLTASDTHIATQTDTEVSSTALDTHLTTAANILQVSTESDTRLTATSSLDTHSLAVATHTHHTSAATPDTHLTSAATPDTHLTSTATPDTHLTSTATPDTHLPATATPDTHLTSTATPDTHLPATATPDTHLTSAATPDTHLTSTATPDTHLPATATPDTHLPATATPDTHHTSAATPDTHLTSTATPDTHLTSTATTDTHLTSAATPDTHLTSTATPDTHLTATATPDTHLTATPDTHLTATPDTHLTSVATPDTHLTSAATPDTHLTSAATPDTHLTSAATPDTHLTASATPDTHLSFVTPPDTHVTVTPREVRHGAVTKSNTHSTESAPDTHLTAAVAAASDTQLTVVTSDRHITAAAAAPDTQLMVLTTPDTCLTAVTTTDTQHVQAPGLQLPGIAHISQLTTPVLPAQQTTETHPVEKDISSPLRGNGQKESVFESSVMESEQNIVTCKKGNMAVVDGRGSIPCQNPYPCCYVSLCLYGQRGTLTTILGERYILILLEGAYVPVCISLDVSEDQISTCRVLWQGEKAVPLSQVLDGTQVEFDAICYPSTNTLVAVIIWQDTKPTVCVQPAGKESYIMISGHGFTCNLNAVDEATESVIVNFDDHTVYAEVSRDVVFVNGRKSNIWELRRLGMGPVFATVFQLLKGDVAGSVTYVCTCLWTGQMPEMRELPMLLQHRQEYVKKSHGLYVKANETFMLFCDIDSALTVSEKGYKLTFKVDGVKKSLLITRDQLYTEEKGEVPSVTSEMYLKSHISRRNKDGQILWAVQMAKLPSSSCSSEDTGSQANAQMNTTLDYRHLETGKEDIHEGLVSPGLKGPQNEYSKEVGHASQSESATDTTSSRSPTGQVRRMTSNIGSRTDEGGLKTGKTCSSSDHVRLETIINCNSIASQPKLENLTCSVAEAGTDIAVLSATGKFIIVTKVNFFINTEKVLASVSLQTELKRFPNVDAVSYEINDPIKILGYVIKHAAVVAWAGRKPTNIDEIVKAWDCKSFQTSGNKNEIVCPKTLIDSSSQSDKVFEASGWLVVDVFYDTGILLLCSKHIKGGIGGAIVCLSCIYKDGYPVDRSQLKSIPTGQMWHCLVQKRPPHELKDGDLRYRVNLAWQGQRPLSYCYSALKDGETKLHQSSTDDTVSSHMKSFSCSTSSLTGHLTPITSSTSSLTDQGRPKTSITSSLTDQLRPKTSITSTLADQLRPKTSSTSSLTDQWRAKTSSTSSLTVKGRPETSNTSCLTDHLGSVCSSAKSVSDQTNSDSTRNNSFMHQAPLQTNMGRKSGVFRPKLEYLTCSVAEAGTDVVILSAASKFILVSRNDLFIDRKKIKDSANLKNELERFRNVGAMFYETEYPMEKRGFVVNHAALVAWAGKKSPAVDDIVEAWKSQTFETSSNRNEASSSKLENDSRFQAGGVLMNVHPATCTLLLSSKYIEGGKGEATVKVSCMYKDGLPVDKKKLKSTSIGCMWHCWAQKCPPHKVKNGEPKYRVILAWQGKKPSASCDPSLDRKTQLRQPNSDCSVSSHMQVLSTSTSSLTGQRRPETSSTSSLTGQRRPEASSTSSLTGQRRPQTSSTSSLTGQRRPQTSSTSSLTGQKRPQTGSTSSLTGQKRPQTSSTSSLTDQRRPKTSSTSSLTDQRRPKTSSTSNLADYLRPKTSSTSSLTGQWRPQTGSTSSSTGQRRPQTSSTSSLTDQVRPKTISTSSLTDQWRPQTGSTSSFTGQWRSQTGSTSSLTGQWRPQTGSTSSLTGQGRPQTSSTSNRGGHCELLTTKEEMKCREKTKTAGASTPTAKTASKRKCDAFPKGHITELHSTIGRVETENGIPLYFSRDCCFLYGLCLRRVELWHVLTLGVEVELELSKSETRVKGVWLGSRPHQQPRPLIPLVTSWCQNNGVPMAATQVLLREAESFSSRFFPTAACNLKEEIIDITNASS